MLKFRKHITAKFMALLTGIIFLNMSFFLTEIRYLGLHLTHTKMVENVIKALAGVGFEEEKDSMAEASGEGGEQIVDLHMTVHPVSCIDSFSPSSKLYGSRHKLDFSSSKPDVITPPPKIS
jgi:hypothetical protein